MTEIDIKLMEKIKLLESEDWEIEKVIAGERYMGTRGDYRAEMEIRLLHKPEKEKAKVC